MTNNHQNTITNTNKQPPVYTPHQPGQSNFPLYGNEFGVSETGPQMGGRADTNFGVDGAAPESSARPGGRGAAADKKGNARLKHSETEQRRRSKINDGFKMLRDLIPERGDQKRDKASFLTEVVDYVKTLQERVRMYEGSNQGYSAETANLTPQRVNSVPFGNINNESHLQSQLAGAGLDEDHVLNRTLANQGPNSLVPDFSGAALYKPAADPALSMHDPIPMPPTFFGNMHDGALLNAEHLNQSQPVLPESLSIENCYVPVPTEEEPGNEYADDTKSNAYSQGIQDILVNSLQSSGVDMSQTNVTVELDIARQANAGTVDTMDIMQDLAEDPFVSQSLMMPGLPDDETYEWWHKNFRSQ